VSGHAFEDFEPGQVYELGSRTVTEAEILEFARQFDPQPFHLYFDAMLGGAASRGAPGVEELRWLEPVRPGDTLTGSLTVLDVTPSATRSDRGTVRIRGELTNQDGVTVLRMTSRGHFGRRAAAE
jgi:acyl dehydratase